MLTFDARFTRETLDTGAVVFHAGDPGDSAYLVESGQVEVLLESEGVFKPVDLLGPGAMFGEIALLDRLPRSGTVRAVEPTVLMRIDRSFVDDLLRATDPVIQYLLRLLLERLRRERAELARGARTGLVPLSGGAAQAAAAATTPAAAAAPSSDRKGTDALHSAALRTLSLSRDLSDAIGNGELELHYQPIFSLSDGRMAGYEALVRWKHPQQGMVRPDEFIPLAERTGLIHRLGHWVLVRAVTDWPALRALCDPGESPPFVSVNLSAAELSVSGIGGTILQAVHERAMDPRELRIELTETAVIGNLDTVAEVTQALRAEGVGVALDDFGTGYAGLSYLQDLPFSCLKIDRAFVAQMLTAQRSLHIVKLALELSRWMGLSTVAEGIEDKATSDALREMGCTHAQGYFHARPMSLPALQAWRRPPA